MKVAVLTYHFLIFLSPIRQPLLNARDDHFIVLRRGPDLRGDTPLRILGDEFLSKP